MLLLCIAKVLNSWTNSNNTIIIQGKHIHKHNEFTASLAGSHIPLRSYSALCLWCTLASPESSALSRHAASQGPPPCPAGPPGQTGCTAARPQRTSQSPSVVARRTVRGQVAPSFLIQPAAPPKPKRTHATWRHLTITSCTLILMRRTRRKWINHRNSHKIRNIRAIDWVYSIIIATDQICN